MPLLEDWDEDRPASTPFEDYRSTIAYLRGAQQERERTAKLLRQLRCDRTHDCGKWHDHYPYTPDELIELINGETP